MRTIIGGVLRGVKEGRLPPSDRPIPLFNGEPNADTGGVTFRRSMIEGLSLDGAGGGPKIKGRTEWERRKKRAAPEGAALS